MNCDVFFVLFNKIDIDFRPKYNWLDLLHGHNKLSHMG